MSEPIVALPRAAETDAPRGIVESVEARRAGRESARVHVEAACASAEDLGARYGAFITRTDAAALRSAQSVDKAVADGGNVGPLAGVAIAVKDLLATRDAPTTAQSLVHDESWYGGRDATAVSLLRQAGAAILGKTSMAEHALGRIDPARPFPVPRNPWDPGRWPGGSSSGSAIAVALGIVDAALGTDTTGSVRIPAAFCGITGLRPTFGLVPLGGCMPTSPTLDVIGPLARSARDCAAVLAVIAPQTAERDGRSAAVWRDRLDGVTIGVPRAKLAEWSGRIAPSIGALFDTALEQLALLGANVVPFDWPEEEALETAMMTIVGSESFAVHAGALREKWTEFGRSFRRLASFGSLISPAAVATARSTVAAARDTLFTRMSDSGVDLIALPTWAQPAPLYAVGVDTDPSDLNLTAALSSTGQPVAVTPMGFDELGLPASLQLAGLPGEDLHVLEVVDAYERIAGWNRIRPTASSGAFPVVLDPDLNAPTPTPEQCADVETALAPAGIVTEVSDVLPIARMLAAMAARSASPAQQQNAATPEGVRP